MEALLNLEALEFSIRPHSFQALVMLRVIYKKIIVANNIGTVHEQKLLLKAFSNECLQQNNGWSIRKLRVCSRKSGTPLWRGWKRERTPSMCTAPSLVPGSMAPRSRRPRRATKL